MDCRPRLRPTVVLAASVLVVLGGCGPKQADAPTWKGELSSPVWRSWKIVNAEPFPSAGHTEASFLVNVHVNPTGLSAFKAKKGPYRVGTVIVKDHYHNDDGRLGARALLMSMEKMESGYDPEHGDWEYARAGPDGELELRGPEKTCWECHQTANTLNPAADYVFGTP